MEKNMENIADKIASAQVGDESLHALDNAVDKAALALKTISDMLPTVGADTPKEAEAKAKMQEILDQALLPYMADFMEAMAPFEGDEE
jgi:hypothetical protein